MLRTPLEDFVLVFFPPPFPSPSQSNPTFRWLNSQFYYFLFFSVFHLQLYLFSCNEKALLAELQGAILPPNINHFHRAEWNAAQLLGKGIWFVGFSKIGDLLSRSVWRCKCPMKPRLIRSPVFRYCCGRVLTWECRNCSGSGIEVITCGRALL